MSRLLPLNSTPLERALAIACDLGIDPAIIRGLADSARCPVDFLPWLAWAMSVEGWEAAETEEQQRALIRESIPVHKRKGTVGAVRRVLKAVGVKAEFKEWTQIPGAVPYTFQLIAWANDNRGGEGSILSPQLFERLNSSLDSLKKQGVEVGRLDKAYRSLGQAANKAEFKAKGYQQLDAGKSGMKGAVGAAVVGVGALAVPTKVSADFGAIVRDIAIKAGIANKPQEQEMSRKIIDTSRDTGMARNDVADVVNQLVGAGMELSKALEYAPVAAKFVVGQGSNGVDTAKMINALGQNAKITDPKQMQQALEAIAYQGQAGSFEAADMAKWFPELLANMGSLGITGMDAVTQLGAMLQVQMKSAGGADEAANNLKNWMGKIGSTDTVQAYKKAGIDYKGSMQSGLQNGMSTLETSMALAQKYIQATDPKRAAAMAEATAKISKESDPEKAKAMMASLEESLRTGDLFADMQVKAALSAYMQNKALYSQLKNDSRDASGILDKNLSERREASSQKWAEMAQSMDDAMRSVGDALRPVTDTVAETLTKVTKGITSLSDSTPGVVTGIVAVGGGLIALKSVFSSFKMAKGLFNLARGSLGGGKAGEVQKVFVTNSEDDTGKDAEPKGKAGKALSLVETGLKAVAAFKGKSADGDDDKADRKDDKKSGEFDLVATGLKVVSLAKEATSASGETGSVDDGVKKVFVVNAGAIGGVAEGPGETRRRGRGSRRRPSRRRPGPPRVGGSVRPPVPRPEIPVPRPPVPLPRPPIPVPVPGAVMSKLGAVAQTVGKVGKIIPGGSLKHQNKKDGKLAVVTVDNDDAPDGLPAVHTDRHIYPNKTAAEAAAKARLAAFNRSTADVRLEMPGRTDIFAERPINAQGFKVGLDGEYLADSVEQVFTQSGWSTTVECNAGKQGKSKSKKKKENKPLKVVSVETL